MRHLKKIITRFLCKHGFHKWIYFDEGLWIGHKDHDIEWKYGALICDWCSENFCMHVNRIRDKGGCLTFNEKDFVGVEHQSGVGGRF